MAIVFIEEVGGPLRVCSKQATAEALGVEWAEIDVSALTHPPHCYTLINGAAVEIAAEVENHARQAFKAARAEQVAAITVTTLSGKTFDGDEKAQDRMARAVAVGSPGDTTTWVLSDNSAVLVTWEELKEALRLAGEAQTAIWAQ